MTRNWTFTKDGKPYLPANMGIIPLFIPRVHGSVTEDFMKGRLAVFLTNFNIDSHCTPNPEKGIIIRRVDFVPIADNANFKQAFVYAETTHIGRWNGMFNISRDASENAHRLVAEIFRREADGKPVKCMFEHKGRVNYWLLLPNLNPLLSPLLRKTAEKIDDETEMLINHMQLLAQHNIPLPSDFDTIDIEKIDNRIETAFTTDSYHRVCQKFDDKLQRLVASNIELSNLLAENLLSGLNCL